MKLYFERYDAKSVYVDDDLYYLLTEANLKRVAKGHDNDGYVIISACRGIDKLVDEIKDDVSYYKLTVNDLDRWAKELSSEELSDKTIEQVSMVNNKRIKDLESKIRAKRYAYIPTFGGYKEEGSDNFVYEKSFVVYPYSKIDDYSNHESSRTNYNREVFEDLITDCMKWASEFNQDTILVKAVNEKAKYINCKTGETEIEFSGVTLNDISKQYFTALKKYRTGMKYGQPKQFTYEGLYAPVAGNIMDCHRRYSVGQLFFNTYDR